jgi:hypothetical protein
MLAGTQVIIRDHVCETSTTYLISKKEKAVIIHLWNKESSLLTNLQNQPLFLERTSWRELDNEHYRVLLALHLSLASELNARQASDPTNTIVRSLMTVMTAFIVSLETRLGGTVSSLMINRISETNVTYDLIASLDTMDFPRPHIGLKIIVDNSF